MAGRKLPAILVVGPLLLGLGIAGMALMRFLFPPSLCANDVVNEIPSPSGSHRAVVFRRDCGATTGYSTQISVLPSDEALPDDSGNLLVLEGEHPIEVSWVRPQHLRVQHPWGPRVFFSAGEAEGVTASIEGRPSNP